MFSSSYSLTGLSYERRAVQYLPRLMSECQHSLKYKSDVNKNPFNWWCVGVCRRDVTRNLVQLPTLNTQHGLSTGASSRQSSWRDIQTINAFIWHLWEMFWEILFFAFGIYAAQTLEFFSLVQLKKVCGAEFSLRCLLLLVCGDDGLSCQVIQQL